MGLEVSLMAFGWQVRRSWQLGRFKRWKNYLKWGIYLTPPYHNTRDFREFVMKETEEVAEW